MVSSPVIFLCEKGFSRSLALFHTDRFNRGDNVAFGAVWVNKNIDRLSQFHMHGLRCIAAELVRRICPGVCPLSNDDLSGASACCEYGICDPCDDTGSVLFQPTGLAHGTCE